MYREEYERFIPGHSISLDFNDPAEATNYYLWGFRSFERPTYCQICYNSIYKETRYQTANIPDGWVE
nr:hypothetical protein [Muricauda sp. DH64]